MKTMQLVNGITMPLVALGTFCTNDETTYEAVLHVLRARYDQTMQFFSYY